MQKLGRSSTLAVIALALSSNATAAQNQNLFPSARQAYDAVRAGTLLLLDIRTPEEWRDTGLAQGAIALDAETPGFEVRLAGLRLDHRGKRIALIDRSGGLSSSLREKLAGRGWREIVAVRGGMLGPGGWLAEGLPVVAYP